MLALSFVIDLITWPLTIPFILGYYAFAGTTEAVIEGSIAGAEIAEGVAEITSNGAAAAGGGIGQVAGGYIFNGGLAANEISLSLSDDSGIIFQAAANFVGIIQTHLVP